jgi:maltooligosyltrehalose trehalohydrolase
LLRTRQREIFPRLQGARALGADVLADKAVSARWQMGDGSTLRIDLNLSAHAVQIDKHSVQHVLHESRPKSAELSQNGNLNPYTAIVSLISSDVVEEQDEQ